MSGVITGNHFCDKKINSKADFSNKAALRSAFREGRRAADMEETNREIALARRPEGVPDGDCFELRETEVPTPEAGEVLVRTRYLSVDPYMRGRMRDGESYAEPWAVGEGMEAGIVDDVIESNHDRWESGDVVLGNLRWSEGVIEQLPHQ
jgi:NADPH-dependent curcumin reductase CurA